MEKSKEERVKEIYSRGIDEIFKKIVDSESFQFLAQQVMIVLLDTVIDSLVDLKSKINQ